MMMRALLLLALATLAAPAPAAAEDGGAVMQVPLNKSQTLRLERAYSKALIGNQDIADVVPTSISSVYVMGKKIGTTNLTLYDRQGGCWPWSTWWSGRTRWG